MNKDISVKRLMNTGAKLCILLLILLISAVSCNKDEGEGGTSTITGKIYVLDYNPTFTIKIGEYYAPDEDVYIIYGNDSIYSDDFKTNYDGSYQFKYLRKGTYAIYAYSMDSTYPSGTNPPMMKIMKTVEITEKNQTVKVDDIVIIK